VNFYYNSSYVIFCSFHFIPSFSVAGVSVVESASVYVATNVVDV